MADWFKFYENDLDETRLQYAISKLPEVIPVWVGILSEACRHKSGTVSWGSDEIELFGFSRRLGVSIPKVNESINLLVEIRYITKEKGSITVIKWGEKQSEYCQRRSKLPTVSRQCPDSVLLEERRGDKTDKAYNKGSKKLSVGQRRLAERFEACLNGQWVNDAGKWINRIKDRSTFDKCERVVADMERAIKDREITTSPAQYAEQRWKEFA